MSMTYQAKHLDYLAQVTELLNKLPANDDLFVNVTLHDEAGQKVGEWSDEIAPDAWYFREVDDEQR